MIFISNIERNILISYLNDFKDLTNDENAEEFSKIILSLYDKNNNSTKTLNGLKEENDKLELFIKEFKSNLNNKLNKNQRLLEKYNQILDDNKRLTRINNSLNDSNNDLDEKISTIREDNFDYHDTISDLKKDIGYYERVLEKLTLIINSLEDDTYTISDALNIDRIESSPYYRLIDNCPLFDRNYYNNRYLNDESIDEVAHYIKTGASLDYNPSEDFNTKWYRKKYLNDDMKVNPLVEYLTCGIKHNNLPTNYSQCPDTSIADTQEYHLIDESGFFDAKYYTDTYDVDEGMDPLAHYMTVGYQRKYKPREDFDVQWYTKTYSYYESSPLLNYVLNSNTRLTKEAVNNYAQEEEYDLSDSQLYHILDESNLFDLSWYFTQYNSYRDDLMEDYILNESNNRYISQLHKDYIQDNPTSDVYQYVYEKLSREYDSSYDYSRELDLDIKDSVEYTILSEDELFDKRYYLKKYGDVWKNASDPISHYLQFGINEGRNPSEKFNTDNYYKINPQIKNRINPLVDYIYNNKPELATEAEMTSMKDTIEYALLDNTEYFDACYYSNSYEVEADDLLEEYMTNGFNQKRNPTVDVDIERLPGVESINDYVDYIIKSQIKDDEYDYKNSKQYLDNYNLLNKSIYFDEDYYRKHNPDIKENQDAIEYYLTREDKTSVPTSKYFDIESYINFNQDLKKAGVDPLIHFIKSGINESRRYKRPKLSVDEFKDYPQMYELYDMIYESDLFDESYYMKHNPCLLATGEDSIIHYLKHGVDLNLNPSAIFSTQRYLKYNPDIKRTGFNPLYHYLSRGEKENRFMFLPEEYYVNNILEKNDFSTSITILDKLKEKTTIILPVTGHYDEFKITLQSILENTNNHYELIILNAVDESEQDNNTSRLLSELERLDKIENIKIIDALSDYDNILMECISSLSTDVVLLDENVILTPHWLVKLIKGVYANRQAATVSAITNNSDLLTQSNKDKLTSIYDKEKNNIDNLNDKSRHLCQKLESIYVERQTPEKHCIYIKKEALSSVDINNAENIGSLTRNLYEKGYISITDSSTFIYTGDNDENEFETNKYNDITVDDINKIISDISFDNKRYERVLCFTQMEDDRPNVDDDIRRLSNRYQTYILAIDDDKIYLFSYKNGHFSLIDNIKTDYSYDTNFFYRVYINILINLNVDLIYTKTHKRLFHPTNRKFTSILEFKHHFEVEELHETVCYDKSFMLEAEKLLNTHADYEDVINHKLNQINFNDKRMVIYTAVTGSYDEPVIPGYVNEDFDYICFTDNRNLKSDFWDIRLMDESDLDDVRKVRSYKILAHKYLSDYDYSLWIDTNIELTDNIIDYIHKYSKNNKLLAIRHIERDCIYDEAHTCIASAKDTDIEVINKQMVAYRNDSYPEHNGLISSGVLFRNHNDPDVIRLMEDWFSQLLTGSYRDQLSFNYVCYKNDFEYDCANLFIIKNSYMQLHDHLSKGFVLRNVDIEYDMDYDLKYTTDDVEDILDNFNEVSIIMPIEDFDEGSIKAIDSVIKYTTLDYKLILVCDDDEDYHILNDKYSSNGAVKILNLPDSATTSKINMAINNSVNDVLILDEKTLVSPKYLQKLIIKAYTDKMIATVSPVSNNTLHDVEGHDFSEDTVIVDSGCIEQSARDGMLIVPVVNRDCVYIKKDAIYAAGFFDVEYDTWEYCLIDYSLRLDKKGWHNTMASSSYVYNDANTKNLYEYLENAGAHTNDDINPYAHDKKILLTRYYEYKDSIGEFNKSIELNNLKRNLKYRLANKNTKKRILYVLHEGVGGTLHTNLELMKNINPHMDAYLLVTSTSKVELYRYNPQSTGIDTNPDMEFKNNLDHLRTWKLKGSYTLLNTTDKQLKQIYFNILVYLNVDIIHIRHLIMSTFDLPKVAAKLAIPVILSFHDYYYICPSHNLVDDNKNYCGGICPPLYEFNTLGGQCNIIGQLNIPQARSIVHWWRDEVSEMFKTIKAFITTSKSAYQLYTKFYPQLENGDFRIIEHGRDLQTPDSTSYVTPINNKGKIKILFPGHIGYTKGYELIKKIKEYDTDDRLEYHYMGSIGGHDDLEKIGVNHGVYKRSEFSDIVHRIKPHFIGIFSIWPETYCHTLTEGWASGVPILAVDIGAVGERIKVNGGGFLINNDPKEAYDKIIKISRNRRQYLRKASRIPNIKFKTTKQMGQDYLEVYEDYLNY